MSAYISYCYSTPPFFFIFLLYAPITLDKCHAWFDLYELLWAVRNGRGTNIRMKIDVSRILTSNLPTFELLQNYAIEIKSINIWQYMYQIDFGLMCSYDVLNLVKDNIYIGKRNADFSDIQIKYNSYHNLSSMTFIKSNRCIDKR